MRSMRAWECPRCPKPADADYQLMCLDAPCPTCAMTLEEARAYVRDAKRVLA